MTSLRLPPVGDTANGIPCPSVIRWCFEPVLARSTGLGPVLGRLESPDVRTVDHHPRPVHDTRGVQFGQQVLVQPLPHPGLVPVAQSAPGGHARAEPQLLRQELPRDAGAEHEQNPSRHGQHNGDQPYSKIILLGVPSPYLPVGLAPRLLWHCEANGWLLLGFAHVVGQHANLTPGSSHLPLVAESVREINSATPPATATGARRMSDQWSRALKRESEFDTSASSDPWIAEHAPLLAALANHAPSYVEVSTLIHSDLVSDGAQVVEWA